MSYLSDTFQPPDFRYAIYAENAERTLQYSPQGWMDYAASWARNKTYYGYGRVFAVSLQFYRDGFELLSGLYEKYGIECEAMLRIYRNDPATYKEWLDFEGDIDFADCTVNRLPEGDYFECGIKEAGLAKNMAAFENNTFEIPFTTSIHIEDTATAMDYGNWAVLGKFISGKVSPPVNPDMSVSINTTSDTSHSSNYSAFFDSDGQSDENGSGVFNLDVMQYQSYGKRSRLMRFAVTVKGSITAAMDGVSDESPADGLQPFDPDGFSITMDWYNGVRVWEIYRYGGTPIPQGGKVDFERSFTIAAGIDDDDFASFTQALRLNITYNIPAQYGNRMAAIVDMQIHVENETEPLAAPFDIRAISVMAAAAALMANIDPDATVTGNLLTTGAARDCYLSSGEGIRGLAEAKLKLSFTDFFQALMSQFGACMFIRNGSEAVIERFEDAFKDDVIMDVGEVSGLTVKPATDRMFNTYKVGCRDVEYKTASGRFEFNALAEFTLPVTRVTDEYNAESRIRFDSFGITDLKVQYLKNSATTASGSDNDVFMIHATLHGERLQPFTEVSIVGDIRQSRRGGAFNHYLSPKRALMRRAGLMASVLARTGGNVRFGTLSKTDARLISRLLGEYYEENPVTERSSLQVDPSKNIFWPDEYEITCAVPKNMVMLMRDNTGGRVRFTHLGNEYYGYPVNCSEEPATNRVQTLTLLASRKGEAVDPELPTACVFTVALNAIGVTSGRWTELRYDSRYGDEQAPVMVAGKPDWLLIDDSISGAMGLRAVEGAYASGVLTLIQDGDCALIQEITVSREDSTPFAQWTGTVNMLYWVSNGMTMVEYSEHYTFTPLRNNKNFTGGNPDRAGNVLAGNYGVQVPNAALLLCGSESTVTVRLSISFTLDVMRYEDADETTLRVGFNSFYSPPGDYQIYDIASIPLSQADAGTRRFISGFAEVPMDLSRMLSLGAVLTYSGAPRTIHAVQYRLTNLRIQATQI